MSGPQCRLLRTTLHPRCSRSGRPIGRRQLQPRPHPASLCSDHAIFIQIHHVASCKILWWGFSIQGPFALLCLHPPQYLSHTQISHFSNSCCYKYSSSSTSVCSATIFLSLSSLCECESRLRIKSHLKASPQSPCASCVPCSLVPINSTTRHNDSASSPGCHEATSILWVFFILVLLRSRHLVFPLCVHASMYSHLHVHACGARLHP